MTLLCLVFCWHVGQATNLQLSQPILYYENESLFTVFNLSWDHSWHNDRNHDAAWLFFKMRPFDGDPQHLRLLSEGHRILSTFAGKELDLSFEVSEDGTGIFVYPKSRHRGRVEATVKVVFDTKSLDGTDLRNVDFWAHGIEMVYIPEGGYELGAPDEKAVPYGGIYRPGKDGAFAGMVQINDEKQELTIGKDGDLYYQAPSGYEGDQAGVLPAEYPKGVADFYMMKYEVTEGFYVDFLNSLTKAEAEARINFKEEYYRELGGSIEQVDGQFRTSFPNKPCKFTSWDDAMALADWAGLRPMTELEFTKAARGTAKAQAGAFPWGTEAKEKVQRLPNADYELKMVNGWTEGELTDANRVYFGASYYWVMDLAGSLWERMITIGHEKGRAFTGKHGDGVLSAGNANEDWPVGQEESGGVGFRGGGFYGYSRPYHEYNPFSPVTYRKYGGWHGTARANAYGTRFVRTN